MKKAAFERLLCLFASMVSAVFGFGQNISMVGQDPTIFAQHFQIGGPAALAIDFMGAVGTPTWSFTTNLALGPSDLFENALSASPTRIAGTLITVQIDPANARRVLIAGTADASGSINLKAFRGSAYAKKFAFTARKPIEAVFVLDRSGSMECGQNANTLPGGAWPGCIETDLANARWGRLRSSMDNFAGKMNALIGSPTKRLGTDLYRTRYFAGNLWLGAAATPLFSGAAAGAFSTGILGDMAAVVGSPDRLGRDGTGIQTGLASALGHFSGIGSTKRKILVLMTDGEQNAPDLTGGATLASLTGAAFPVDLEVYVIGYGLYASGAGRAALEALPNSTGRTFFLTPPDDLNAFFTNVQNAMFAGYSPQLVRFEDQTFIGQNSADFPLNAGASGAFFEAVFEEPFGGDDRFFYRLFRDGAEVTKKASLRKGDHFATFFVDFEADTTWSSAGKWTLTVTDPTGSSASFGSKIRLSATIDEHAVRFGGAAGRDFFAAGDKIEPTVDFRFAQKGIENAVVTATVFQPGADIGDLLARTKTDTLPAENSESGSCALRKYAALQKENPSAIKAFLTQKKTVLTLAHVGNGKYAAPTGGFLTDPTGVYKIVYEARAAVAGIGEVQRTLEQTINVSLPALDQTFEGSTETGKDGLFLHTLTARPSYTVGGQKRFVGPGWAGAFEVSGAKLSSVQENDCDGAYTLFLSSPTENPQIQVKLAGLPLFDGRVKSFPNSSAEPAPVPFKKWSIALAAGRTFPLGSLDVLFDSDFALEASAGRRLSQNWSIGATGGHYRFAKSHFINGLTAHVGRHFGAVGSAFDLSARVGGGFFQPKSGAFQAGGCARFEADWRFRADWAATLGGSYSYLLADQTSFGAITLGLKRLF